MGDKESSWEKYKILLSIQNDFSNVINPLSDIFYLTWLTGLIPPIPPNRKYQIFHDERRLCQNRSKKQDSKDVE